VSAADPDVVVIHGGQTGVDRGAHEAALDVGWLVDGYMPKDVRDERGPIPIDVARYLKPCARSGYGARTEENVHMADALLVVVRDADDPRATPGTAKTIDLAARHHMRRMIVDPSANVWQLASWIRNMSQFQGRLPLGGASDPIALRLMVAGPRESKWASARIETASLLRRVALEMRAIDAGTSEEQNRRLPRRGMHP
jgi:Circularly permutated YpsA SLOG family